MYINYISKWIVETLQIKVPLVLTSKDVYLISIWNLFMLTVFLGIFICLVKYLITDHLSFKVGNEDISYSSRSAIFNSLKSIKKAKSNDKESDN